MRVLVCALRVSAIVHCVAARVMCAKYLCSIDELSSQVCMSAGYRQRKRAMHQM